MKQIKKFYHISNKPTKYFFILVGAIFLLFIIAFTHNNNIAYIVMFFLFSISLNSLIMGRINILKAKVEIKPTKIFANTPTKIPIFTTGEDIHFNSIYTFHKRGYNDLKIKIYSSYPLYLATFSKIVIKKVLVYPELKGVSLQKGFIKTENIDFDGLKNYNYDDIKFIHWPSFAKGEMQVKKFSGDSEAINHLIFDINKIPGDKEDKISQLALWCYEAFEKNLKFTLILDEKIESKKGFDEIFKRLALY